MGVWRSYGHGLGVGHFVVIFVVLGGMAELRARVEGSVRGDFDGAGRHCGVTGTGCGHGLVVGAGVLGVPWRSHGEFTSHIYISTSVCLCVCLCVRHKSCEQGRGLWVGKCGGSG